MTKPRLLIGDIGGTFARFALADATAGKYRDMAGYQCADHPSATAAIRHYLKEMAMDLPEEICLAVAGPIVDDAVRFTNNDWNISSKQLKAEFGATQVKLINDFEAKALAITTLADDERLAIGNSTRADLQSDRFTVGIIGPGTGLGAAGLLRREDRDTALVTEAGHASFAPENSLQQEIDSLLRKKYGRVSNERLLSGPGIENIYRALRQIHGKNVNEVGAAQIGGDALAETDDIAVETCELFFEVLGQVAGDFALSTGSFEGIFISGGIVARYVETLRNSKFRSAFENKGRYRSLMQNIPTELITQPQSGLNGASICGVRSFRSRN